MDLEEAINTAMDYETRIRDIYREAAEDMAVLVAKNFLKTMGEDEQHHLDYVTKTGYWFDFKEFDME